MVGCTPSCTVLLRERDSITVHGADCPSWDRAAGESQLKTDIEVLGFIRKREKHPGPDGAGVLLGYADLLLDGELVELNPMANTPLHPGAQFYTNEKVFLRVTVVQQGDVLAFGLPFARGFDDDGSFHDMVILDPTTKSSILAMISDEIAK